MSAVAHADFPLLPESAFDAPAAHACGRIAVLMEKAAEIDLIRRACRGDGDAAELLIRAHQDSVYAFILRLSGRPHLAEDVVQEAFVRVLRNLDRFDERFRFSTWLFTIAKRLYVNAMQKHRPVYDTDAVALRGGTEESPSGQSQRAEQHGHVRDVLDRALDALNQQQREIVLLFHQQSWPITEIALYLHMPEGTIKSHLHRARRRMRQVISSDEASLARVEEVFS